MPQLTTADSFRLQANIPGCEWFQRLTSLNHHQHHHRQDSTEADNLFQSRSATCGLRHHPHHIHNQQQQQTHMKITQLQNHKVKNSSLKSSPKLNRSSNGLLKAKQSKATTLTQELSSDDLNRILDLVSQLDYLKLVSPRDFIPSKTTTNNNKNSSKTTSFATSEYSHNESNGHNPMHDSHSRHNTSTIMSNFINNDDLISESKYDNSVDRDNCYIFEKVNYIRRMKQRKRALKELRKAKARLKKSPNRISECPNTQTKCDLK